MNGKGLAILSIIYVVMLTGGGLIFFALEYTSEQETVTSSRLLHYNFLVNNTCVEVDELEVYLKRFIMAYRSGVLATNQTTSNSNWDVSSSIFFSSTVLTTIGYGNISPSTTGGRVFCVFFALFGVPMTAVLLSEIGSKLKGVIVRIQERMTKSKQNKAHMKWIMLGIILIGMVLLWFIPAIIFMAIEGWTYGEAIYYCLITLTTIGFGDFVPATTTEGAGRHVYKISILLWFVVGLSWLSMVLSLGSEVLENKLIVVSNEQVADVEQRKSNSELKDVKNVVKNDTDSVQSNTKTVSSVLL